MSQIPTKIAKRRKIENPCSDSHKYLRFSKKNKTYRTDCYICAECGHNRPINTMFGVRTKCWECGQIFPFQYLDRFPLKPNCGKCNEQIPIPLKSEDQSKEALIADILGGLIDADDN